MSLFRILGWVDHLQRDLPHQATCVPIWLCTWDEFQAAIDAGLIESKETVAIVPRLHFNACVYGLTDTGRAELIRLTIAAQSRENVVNSLLDVFS